MTKQVTTYINRIRNAEKKQYAIAYALYILNGEQGDEPRHQISYMAAQGVRLNLFSLLRAR